MHRLCMKMNLTEVLTQAEELFYKYCMDVLNRWHTLTLVAMVTQ